MEQNKLLNFLRSEVTFWITIIMLIVSGVVAFTQLAAKVAANEHEIQDDNILLESIDVKVDALLIRQAEIQKDIQFLKDAHK